MSAQPYIFISFTKQDDRDAALANHLAKRLHQCGARVFHFENTLSPGSEWASEIHSAIEECTHFLVILSAESIRAKWVIQETQLARDRQQRDRGFSMLQIAINEKDEYSRKMHLDHLTRVMYHRDPEDQFRQLASALKLEYKPEVRGGTETQNTLFISEIRKLVGGVFVDRKDHIEDVRRWIDNHECGFRLIEGAIGVGKSALMAELRHQKSLPEDEDKLSNVDVVSYFVGKRDAQSTRPEVFLLEILRRIAELYHIDTSEFGDKDELKSELKNRLEEVSRELGDKARKLMILVDGLDEALELGRAIEGTLLESLPQDLPPRIYMLMASRPIQDVLPFQYNRQVQKLEGMTAEYIGELLKNALKDTPISETFQNAILVRSAGSPIYVRLLVEAGKAGYIKFNDDYIPQLPENLEVFLQKIVKQLMSEDERIIYVLVTLARARERLTDHQIADINGISADVAAKLLALCSAAVTKHAEPLSAPNSMETKVTTYSVFHDSLSTHLMSFQYRDFVREINRRFLNYAARHFSGKRLDVNVSRAIDLVLAEGEIPAKHAQNVSKQIELVSHMLTARDVLIQCLVDHPIRHVAELYFMLSRNPEPAISHVVIECLTQHASRTKNKDGETEEREVANLMLRLISETKRSRNKRIQQEILNASRVALNVSAALVNREGIHQAIQDVLFAACCHRDTTIRTFGVMTVFKVTKIQYDVGIGVLWRLADSVTWHGILRPSKLEPFIGCALGLFFEDSENEILRGDLHKMCSKILRNIIGFRIATWVFPSIASRFLNAIPEDYNGFNLVELKHWKKRSRKNSRLVKTLNRMLDFMDPSCGTDEEFADLLDRELQPEQLDIEDGFAVFLAFQEPISSRVIAGRELLLDLEYKYWQAMKDTKHVFNQHIMFHIRIIQVGMSQLSEKPRLSDKWTKRVEEILQHFYYENDATCWLVNEYICCGLICGLAFLARQRRTNRLTLVKKLINDAWEKTLEDAPRERQRDTLLVRALEVVGIEYGTYDRHARHVAWYGLECFLNHTDKFDEELWNRVSNVLSRMRTYFPEEMADFLEALPDDISEKVQLRMSRILPNEKIGTLISLRAEKVHSRVAGELPDEPGGLRPAYQAILRSTISSSSVSSTFRQLAQQLAALFR